MTEDKNKPTPKGSLVLSASLPAVTKITKSAPHLPEASVVASTGSVAVAGDNLGSIFNVNAQSVTIVERQITRELPSYLSKVVARFSEDLSEYNSGPKRSLPPEVSVKLAYNDFPPAHHIITDYSKYSNVLEATYRGVEQHNDDARRLVRRRAAVAYAEQLNKLCAAHSVKHAQAHDFARSHAVPLVMAVVAALLVDSSAGSTAHVMQETAHLPDSMTKAAPTRSLRPCCSGPGICTAALPIVNWRSMRLITRSAMCAQKLSNGGGVDTVKPTLSTT